MRAVIGVVSHAGLRPEPPSSGLPMCSLRGAAT